MYVVQRARTYNYKNEKLRTTIACRYLYRVRIIQSVSLQPLSMHVDTTYTIILLFTKVVEDKGNKLLFAVISVKIVPRKPSWEYQIIFIFYYKITQTARTLMNFLFFSFFVTLIKFRWDTSKGFLFFFFYINWRWWNLYEKSQ